jgi:hypothetical protein
MSDGRVEVEHAAIDLTDARYTSRFHEFPMPHPFRELIGMIPAELRRSTGEISIPDAANCRCCSRAVGPSPVHRVDANA